MKNLIENWKKTLIEIEELPPQNKSAIFDNVEKEAAIIVNNNPPRNPSHVFFGEIDLK